MTIDAELARWGEPPVRGAEEVLAALLDDVLERRARGEEVRLEELLADVPELVQEGAALVQAAECLELLVTSVLEHSRLEEGESLPGGVETEAYDGTFPEDEGLPDPLPGRYRVRKALGEGRFGRVWLADHLALQIPVALKTLHLDAAPEEREVAVAALRNEARLLARLRHPNVVQVYDLQQAGVEYYLVLQYVDGGSLAERLEREGPLGWQAAARYIADVGEALLHVHAAGLLHRDIKPANILWDRERDEALLTDFGVAARLEDARHEAGTGLFMAPECFAGQGSPATDVYSLAASMFTLVTGRVPFPAKTRTEVLEKIGRGLPDPEPLFAGVPERLERVIRAGLAATPGRRPDAAAFVADLRGSLNQLLADSLTLPVPSPGLAAPTGVRLSVTRWEGGDRYVPVAATHPAPAGVTRNMTKVPPLPARAGLRTSDRVRIEVVADRDGYVTVFNVGPTGQLNLLYPDAAPAGGAPPPLPANRPLRVSDVALTPPAGRERLFAVWTRLPLQLRLEQLLHLAAAEPGPVSSGYRATRNMERVQESVRQLQPEDWRVAVLELEHDAW
jgi:tRNA A-37 threonylcarbamoyl transferase component Bud32